MAQGIGQANPGRSRGPLDPTIRPKGASAQTDSKPFALPDTKINQNTRAAPVEKTTLAPPVQQQKAPELKPSSMPTRPMDKSDIVTMLMAFQKSPNGENQSILSSIIQHGLPASSETFETVSRLVQGREKPNSTESAVISVLKGVGDISKSVEALSSFVGTNPQIAQTLLQVQTALQQAQQSILQHRAVLNNDFVAGLAGILSEMDNSIKKLTQKTDLQDILLKIKRPDLIGDAKALFEFLGGVDQKLQREFPQNARLQGLRQDILQVKERLGELLDNLTSQAILSQDSVVSQVGNDKFFYFQIPNPFSEKQSQMEVLIRKDPQNTQAVNPAKTRIVTKFETEELGELAVTIDIEDKKLWYLFHTDNPDTKAMIVSLSGQLKEAMEGLNYQVKGIQAVEKKLDIKKLLVPTLNLDKLSRVNAEV